MLENMKLSPSSSYLYQTEIFLKQTLNPLLEKKSLLDRDQAKAFLVQIGFPGKAENVVQKRNALATLQINIQKLTRSVCISST